MSYTYAVRQVAAPSSMLSATVPPRMENLLKIKYASDFSTIKLPTTSREGMMHSFVLLDDHEIMQAELVKKLESLISVSSCVIVYIQSRVWCEMLLETFEDKQPQVISTMYHGMSTYEQKITNKKAFVQETKEKKKQPSTMAVCQTQRELLLGNSVEQTRLIQNTLNDDPANFFLARVRQISPSGTSLPLFLN